MNSSSGTVVPHTPFVAKTAISDSKLWKKRLGDFALNPYVGCEHGCAHCYCPGMPGVKFFNQGHSQADWGKYLFAKTGLLEALDRQLRSFTPDKARRTSWGDGWILMSLLTDCYTPAEAKLQLTRACLQRLLEAGHKVRVQTRSVLVERDFDLLRAHPGQVVLGTSLPHLDDNLARVLEPRASSPTRRARMLEKAAAAEIPIYVAAAPIYPFHGPEALLNVVETVAPLKPCEIFCEVLNPEGNNLERVALALRTTYPGLLDVISAYPGQTWARFTWEILDYGHRDIPGFVAWPDTHRAWSKFLSDSECSFLNQFLPAPGMHG